MSTTNPPQQPLTGQTSEEHGAEEQRQRTSNLGATEDKINRGYDVVTPSVTDMGLDERGRDDPDEAGFDRSPRLTPSGTLASETAVGPTTPSPFGGRGDGGGGQLNAEVPEGTVGAGPLGGSPARGDTADAAAERRKFGMTAPSSAGSRGIHLGIGHNSPTGESTPGTHAGPPDDTSPTPADTGRREASLPHTPAPTAAADLPTESAPDSSPAQSAPQYGSPPLESRKKELS